VPASVASELNTPSVGGTASTASVGDVGDGAPVGGGVALATAVAPGGAGVTVSADPDGVLDGALVGTTLGVPAVEQAMTSMRIAIQAIQPETTGVRTDPSFRCRRSSHP
jgi:hypothetical protein